MVKSSTIICALAKICYFGNKRAHLTAEHELLTIVVCCVNAGFNHPLPNDFNKNTTRIIRALFTKGYLCNVAAGLPANLAAVHINTMLW